MDLHMRAKQENLTTQPYRDHCCLYVGPAVRSEGTIPSQTHGEEPVNTIPQTVRQITWQASTEAFRGESVSFSKPWEQPPRSSGIFHLA